MIVGVSAVPPGAAVVIRQAVKQMIERGEVSPRAEWQALEFLASDYLAGP
jgi:DNA-binding transcriptional regulator YdaS (Cro superfamily)